MDFSFSRSDFTKKTSCCALGHRESRAIEKSRNLVSTITDNGADLIESSSVKSFSSSTTQPPGQISLRSLLESADHPFSPGPPSRLIGHDTLPSQNMNSLCLPSPAPDLSSHSEESGSDNQFIVPSDNSWCCTPACIHPQLQQLCLPNARETPSQQSVIDSSLNEHYNIVPIAGYSSPPPSYPLALMDPV